MSGVIFIVSIPRKEFEEDLRKKEKTARIVVEKDKYEKTASILHELRENKRFGTIKSSIESFAQNDENNIVMSKCKSTDCLHENDREMDLLRSKSETTLAETEPTLKENVKKLCWDELKQVIKPRKNKLKITQPARSTDILAAFHWDTPMEIIVSEVLVQLTINSAVWESTRNEHFWQVMFSMESCNLCEELIQVLRTFGIGTRYQSTLSVVPCALFYKSDEAEENKLPGENGSVSLQSETGSAWARFSSSVRSRTNLAQVLHEVRTEAALTFDWIFLLILAAFVAAIGLVENSTVILVASMLISPLMGPITAGTLGTAVNDRSLQTMGVVHEILGLFLSLIIGFIFGLTMCAIDVRYGVSEWPTYEMMSRCEIRSLWIGVLVAIPSGAGVALAVLGEYTASLVGVAISASLLPPAVNAGLLWAMALVHLISMNEEAPWIPVVKSSYYSTNSASELAILGAVSLCLTLVNIICIFFAGVAVYKVKEVCPLERKDISWWRANNNLLQSRSTKWDQTKKGGYTQHIDSSSKWCSDQNENELLDKNLPSPAPIQSDTITFRRPTPAIQRLRAQNIEAFCLQKAKLNENYLPLNQNSPEYRNKTIKDTNIYTEPISSISLPNSVKKQYNEEYMKSLNYDDRHNFYGSPQDGPSNEGADVNERIHPTIEPTLSFTVDSKKYGPFFSSCTYDV